MIEIALMCLAMNVPTIDYEDGNHVEYRYGYEKMSPMWGYEACHGVQEMSEPSWRRESGVLPTVRSGVSPRVVQDAGSTENDQESASEAAPGNDGRGSSSDLRSTGGGLRDLWDGLSRQVGLAFGSRPRNGSESGSAVPQLQPRDRLLAGQCTDAQSCGVVSSQVCLALNVFFEARDQSLAGQVAVAQVTMNRVASPNYPNDVCSVVYQHKQFSWYWDGKSDVPREEKAWRRAQMVAQGVLAGSGHADLEGVLHYHALTTTPYWVHSMIFVTRIENHVFYIEDRGVKRGTQEVSRGTVSEGT